MGKNLVYLEIAPHVAELVVIVGLGDLHAAIHQAEKNEMACNLNI